ncbi:MAG: DUF4827 domain-containing protein [Tannerellaceae bacterium]|jgi:hypothetical protein|nr:DUF4827 domain-containing protein [Tannerellaceae bacterium]
MIKVFYMAALLIAIIAASSCQSNRSFANMQKEQNRAISRLMADSGYVLLKEYPADGVFQPNEFYKFDNGVYMNVIDSGNGRRAIAGVTSILCRGIGRGLVVYDTLVMENLSNSSPYPFPILYIYGSSTAVSAAYDEFTSYVFSQALFKPMEHVGDSSTVKLIIPFEQSSSYLRSIGEAFYFHKLRYVFELR